MDTHVAATINSLLRTYIIIMHTSVHALTCMNLHLLDQGCHAMQILRASDCVFYFFIDLKLQGTMARTSPTVQQLAFKSWFVLVFVLRMFFSNS